MRKIDGFKLSVLTISIAAAAQANAALYQVEEVTGMPASTYARTITEDASAENCFESTCVSDDSSVAGETILGRMGEPYRDEVPYMGFFRNDITEYGDLQTYCYDFLGYSTCESWSEFEWAAISRERNAWSSGYQSNATAYNNGEVLDLSEITGGDAEGSTVNSIVNDITASGSIVGTTSAAFIANNNGNYPREFRKRGYVYAEGESPLELKPIADINDVITTHGQTSGFASVSLVDGSSLYAGSSATNIFGSDYSSDKDGSHDCTVGTDSYACNNLSFVTQATVWDESGVGYRMVSRWIDSNTTVIRDKRARQASVRGMALVDVGEGELPYGVGYSSEYVDSNGISMAARAVVFKPKDDFDATDLSTPQWDLVTIPGIELVSSSTAIRLYTTAVDINDSGVVIGHAKNEVAESRIYPLKSFIYDINSGSTSLFDSLNSSFFGSVHSVASSINNHNEIVGWTDIEQVNEVSGRQRRQRGFIYRYGEERNSELFGNREAWLLDDLTFGDEDTNLYRIAQAHDINDAGVISATALKCESGYDSNAIDATCSSTESLVAVKLMPNPSGEVSTRPTESTVISREGGSLGWLGLSILGLLGFRRRQ